MVRRTKPEKDIKKAKEMCGKVPEKAFEIDKKLWRLDYFHLEGIKYLPTIHTIDNLVLYQNMMNHLKTSEKELEKWKKEKRGEGKVENFRSISMGEIPMFAYSNQDKKHYDIAQVTITSIHGPREVSVTWPVIKISGKQLQTHLKDCKIHNTQQFELTHDAFVKGKKIQILSATLANRENTIRANEMTSKKLIDDIIADFERKVSLSERQHQQDDNVQTRKIKEERDDAVNKLARCSEILERERAERREERERAAADLEQANTLLNDQQAQRIAWMQHWQQGIATNVQLSKKKDDVETAYNKLLDFHNANEAKSKQKLNSLEQQIENLSQKNHALQHQNLMQFQNLMHLRALHPGPLLPYQLMQPVPFQTGPSMLSMTPISPTNLLHLTPPQTLNPFIPLPLNYLMNAGQSAGQGTSQNVGRFGGH